MQWSIERGRPCLSLGRRFKIAVELKDAAGISLWRSCFKHTIEHFYKDHDVLEAIKALDDYGPEELTGEAGKARNPVSSRILRNQKSRAV